MRAVGLGIVTIAMVTILAVGAITLSARSRATQTGPEQAASSVVVSTLRPQIEGLRARGFHSIRELTVGAEIVVLARATPTRVVERIQTVPFSVTTMQAVQVWKGALPVGSSFKLRQLGDSLDQGEVSLVSADQTYVLFIDRFTFGPGRETDQFVVVGGGAGSYLVAGSQARRVDPDSPDLPARVELGDLRSDVLSYTQGR
jgi:hypothetical protein